MKRPVATSAEMMPELPGLKSVVLATDFSPGADAALRRVAFLPLQGKAQIALIHVLPVRFDPATDSLVRDVAQQHLDEVRESLLTLLVERNRADVRVKSRLIRGIAPHELGRLAEQTGSDLVVLGRRGTPVLRNLLLGSAAQYVARHARVPVLVVAKPPRTPYRQVVVGFDLSPDAVRAAALAARLVPVGGHIEVVHAYREVFSGGTDPASHRRLAATQLAETRQLILRAIAPLLGKASEWPIRMERGDPRKVLLDVASERKADLIAVGSTGRTGLKRQLMGSVAEGVLQLAKTDMLITPRPAGSDPG